MTPSNSTPNKNTRIRLLYKTDSHFQKVEGNPKKTQQICQNHEKTFNNYKLIIIRLKFCDHFESKPYEID